MDNPLMHYILLDEQIQLDGTIAKLAQKIVAVVADATDKAIVEAIIAAARAEAVTDLYMIDKKFILDAIREKQELENQKPLTNGDRIRAMSVDELALFLASRDFEQNRQLLESNGIVPTATQLSVLRENLLRTWWNWLCQSAKEET